MWGTNVLPMAAPRLNARNAQAPRMVYAKIVDFKKVKLKYQKTSGNFSSNVASILKGIYDATIAKQEAAINVGMSYKGSCITKQGLN